MTWYISSHVRAFPTGVITPANKLDSLEIPITRVENPFRNALRKRSGSGLEIDLRYEQDLFYAATLDIGTPVQEITVLFDTGSSDMWVMSSVNPYCLPEKGTATYSNKSYNGGEISPSIDCQLSGTYDANVSSSIQKLDIGRFYTNYSDGSFADGYWCRERLVLNGRDISNLQFGVADVASTPAGGVLGIGFQSLESVRGYSDAPGDFYPNFPQVLKNEGLINTVAYSLHLNSNSGSIVFGATDRTKFAGDMYTFPMVNQYPNIVDKPATLAITLQGLGIRSAKKCKQKTVTTTKTAALLDSGTSLMSAPQNILQDMASFVNAFYSEKDQIYMLKCPPSDDDTEFHFDFGDLTIKVPLSNLILQPPQNGYCGFGVLPGDESFTLGQVFLSSAYVVYDLDHYQISLAQARANSQISEGQVEQIPENGNIRDAIRASAMPWSSTEPFSVTSDIFEGNVLHCTSRQSANFTTSSNLYQSKPTSPNNATYPLARSTASSFSVIESAPLSRSVRASGTYSSMISLATTIAASVFDKSQDTTSGVSSMSLHTIGAPEASIKSASSLSITSSGISALPISSSTNASPNSNPGKEVNTNATKSHSKRSTFKPAKKSTTSQQHITDRSILVTTATKIIHLTTTVTAKFCTL